MRYSDSILPEFDHEMANTRKVLECVPDEKLGWKARPELNSIGWNACHLAEIPGWVEGVLNQTSWDVAPDSGEHYQSPQLESREQIVQLFDENVVTARQSILKVKDEELEVPWSLLARGKPLFTLPRAAVIRSFVMNHLIHHRAHLCVYLRLNGIEVPPMYGA